jgi:hypothetical protein
MQVRGNAGGRLSPPARQPRHMRMTQRKRERIRLLWKMDRTTTTTTTIDEELERGSTKGEPGGVRYRHR